jgi:hypothetical protein
MDGQIQIEVDVPPSFKYEAISIEEGGSETVRKRDVETRKRKAISQILRGCPDNRSILVYLREEENALEDELEEEREEREGRLNAIESRLRNEIEWTFPNESDENKQALFQYVRDGERGLWGMWDVARPDLTTDEVAEEIGRAPPAPPTLWEKIEDKDQWREFTREYRVAFHDHEVDEIEFYLSIVRGLKQLARAGKLPISPDPAPVEKDDPPYHEITSEYLKLAYRWLEAGNHPSGEKPTELWQYIRKKTGKSLRTIRQTFQNQGWYEPHTGEKTPTAYTVNAVLEEGAKYFAPETESQTE